MGHRRSPAACTAHHHGIRWRESAIVASLIIMVLESLILFAAPAIIGLPAHIPTRSRRSFGISSESYPPGVGRAAALSLPLMLVTATLLWLQPDLRPVGAAAAGANWRVALEGCAGPSSACGLRPHRDFRPPIGVMLVLTSISTRGLRGLSAQHHAALHRALFSGRRLDAGHREQPGLPSAAAFVCVIVGAPLPIQSERRTTRTAPALEFCRWR